ncbi:MAG TPA: type IV toxin-antitoxin system AbiEi family antitoxin domain-containing protein [Candidatus Baltobacteraceae bacterium]|nr:type IV toxin-antitoxin system AbiEi family antitoxin domain-containing protein [Candidatus Baltobacteraceae bacterium]
MAKVEDALRELAAEHEGLFTAKEAEAAGVARALVVQLAHRGRLDRVAQGLYRFPSWPTTGLQQFHEAVLWPGAHRELAYALVSHDSALELYSLTQLNPGTIHVTLPPKTRISRQLPAWLRLHFADVAENDRAWEQGIPIVSIPRAIEDVAPVHGIDVVHRAVSEARERHLLREDELQRLVDKFGTEILEPYRAG